MWRNIRVASAVAVLMPVIGGISMAAAQEEPESVNPGAVYERLSDRYTEAQREAYFESEVRGKHANWSMRVLDVQKGWWNYDISGRIGKGREVLCKVDITPKSTAQMASLSKGSEIRCQGKIKFYTKFVGVTVLIDDAQVR